MFLLIFVHIGKGGKNRRRGKNENDREKRELIFKEDGQEYAQVKVPYYYYVCDVCWYLSTGCFFYFLLIFICKNHSFLRNNFVLRSF